MDVEAIEPPPPVHRLDVESVERIPRDTGVYAAWLVDRGAMAELGVEGALPFLLYVGKADGQGGLRNRLRRHAKDPWAEIADLLAAQFRVLPLWWAVSNKNTDRRTLPTPPLAQMATDQARSWQHDRFVWGWHSLDRSLVRAHETTLIARRPTLLNRHGRGYKHQGPPQLRAVGPYAPSRARWLFHAAWIAVLDQRTRGWAKRGLRATRVAVDDQGWPVRLGEGQERLVKVPRERDARAILARCAPPELTDAARRPSEANEARAWWAAYAGAEFLPRAVGVEDALRVALRRVPESSTAPTQLPAQAKREQLIQLVSTLPGIAH